MQVVGGDLAAAREVAAVAAEAVVGIAATAAPRAAKPAAAPAAAGMASVTAAAALVPTAGREVRAVATRAPMTVDGLVVVKALMAVIVAT
ncbi:hypothetical protein CV751_08275 [Achromobacter ruhlandii]|nr:hypothetical protein CV751_08275 [Achromobacter ruhlandii]